MSRSLTMLVLVMAALAWITPAQAAASGVATEAKVNIRIDTPARATATVDQIWDGAAAKGMRQSLDVFFGAGDGTLTEDELDRIVNASEEDMMSTTLPFIYFDGQPVKVAGVALSIKDAAGRITSFEPMSMHHEIALDLTPGAAANHTLSVFPLWDGRVNIEAPEGWSVGEVSGIANANGAPSGVMKSDQQIKVEFSLDGSDATIQESNTNTTGPQPGEKPKSIPTASTALTAAALAIAVGVAAAFRRRR